MVTYSFLKDIPDILNENGVFSHRVHFRIESVYEQKVLIYKKDIHKAKHTAPGGKKTEKDSFQREM